MTLQGIVIDTADTIACGFKFRHSTGMVKILVIGNGELGALALPTCQSAFILQQNFRQFECLYTF